jgi:hypothetical protein
MIVDIGACKSVNSLLPATLNTDKLILECDEKTNKSWENRS